MSGLRVLFVGGSGADPARQVVDARIDAVMDKLISAYRPLPAGGARDERPETDE